MSEFIIFGLGFCSCGVILSLIFNEKSKEYYNKGYEDGQEDANRKETWIPTVDKSLFYDYDDIQIAFDKHSKALLMRDELSKILKQDGRISVSDILAVLGLDQKATEDDITHGWTSMDGIYITSNDDDPKYILVFPPAKELQF